MTGARDPADGRTLTSLLDDAARGRADDVLFRRPDAPAVTYGEFLDQRDRVTSGLAQRGVGAGDAVVVDLATSVATVAVLCAVHRLGAVAAMSDPANTARERDGIRRRSRAVLTVTAVPGEGGATPTVTPDELTVAAPALSPGVDPVGPDSPATVLFTSGTTAESKAVLYRHGHHVAGADVYAAVLGLGPDSVLMHHFPLFHMNGLNQLAAALSVGCEVLLVERFRSGRFDALLDAFAPTATFLNGTHIKMLREAGTAPARPSPLRRVGMALRMADADYDWFEARYGAVLTEGYGQTESITLCLANPVSGARRATCGLPVPGYEIRIVPDGPDRTGELQVRSANRYVVMEGYVGDAAATAAAFDDGWLRTGDVVRIDPDGFVHYVDRTKDIIKRAGENISAREVESVLEAHPDVAEAAVVGVPDELREELPVAFVVVRPGAAADEGALREHCAALLARHKVPAAFHVLADLPRTAVGKVEKRALRARAAEEEQP